MSSFAELLKVLAEPGLPSKLQRTEFELVVGSRAGLIGDLIKAVDDALSDKGRGGLAEVRQAHTALLSSLEKKGEG